MLAVAVVVYRLRWPEHFTTETVGWASLMVALLVVGGIQMMFFGVLGEYTGRTFLNVNRKPQSAIREVLNSAVTEERLESRALSVRH
ncbi:MAG TPA: hypothetical protein VLU47_17885, partial [Blastocatellia bacterium]|nr:hypothetical protein [Blastocatellia bacterium]